MLKKCLSWLRQLAWGDVAADNAKLAALLLEAKSVVGGLNRSVGQLEAAYQNECLEKMLFLGSLAMQAGGHLELPVAFVDTVRGGNYTVNIKVSEDKSVLHVSLTETQPTEPPFVPAGAATEPPDIGEFDDDED